MLLIRLVALLGLVFLYACGSGGGASNAAGSGSGIASSGESANERAPQPSLVPGAAEGSTDGTKDVLPKSPATVGTSSLAAQLTAGPMFFAPDAATNIKDFGARGDGVTDDTAAIQAALKQNRVNPDGSWIDDAYGNYFNGRPKTLFFPAGTYLISDTVQWAGCCMTLQGQGPGVTTFKLKDGASGLGKNPDQNPP